MKRKKIKINKSDAKEIDAEKVARLLGAKVVGKVNVRGGFLGALESAEIYRRRMKEIRKEEPMKRPIEPIYKGSYYKIDEELYEKLSWHCSLQDIIDICEQEGFDFEKVHIDLGFKLGDGFTIFEDKTVKEHREEWERFGKEQNRYEKWAEDNPKEAQKHRMEDQIERLKQQIKDLEEDQ